MIKENTQSTLEIGDVIQILEAGDSDYLKLFIYRGSKQNTHFFDDPSAVTQEQAPYPIGRIPYYQTLFNLNIQPSSLEGKIYDPKYRDICQDLSQNEPYFAEAKKLNLTPRYSQHLIESERQPNSTKREITTSGIHFEGKLPNNSLFHFPQYIVSQQGILGSALVALHTLDKQFNLGVETAYNSITTRRQTHKEQHKPIIDPQNYQTMYQQLLAKGVHLFIPDYVLKYTLDSNIDLIRLLNTNIKIHGAQTANNAAGFEYQCRPTLNEAQQALITAGDRSYYPQF